MSAGILTHAGRALFARKQAAEQPLIIDRFMLANISALDPTQPANPDEILPSVVDQVDTLPVTDKGFISPDEVVYSLYLGTDVGNYSFNWIGLLAEDDTLVAVRYIDTIKKHKTANGETGDAMTRNFVVAHTDAQAITTINVEASTWQLEFDVADNLTTNNGARALSARQGVQLKALIDGLQLSQQSQDAILAKIGDSTSQFIARQQYICDQTGYSIFHHNFTFDAASNEQKITFPVAFDHVDYILITQRDNAQSPDKFSFDYYRNYFGTLRYKKEITRLPGSPTAVTTAIRIYNPDERFEDVSASVFLIGKVI